MIGAARVAIGFLTRLPAGRPERVLTAAELSRAAAWFPAVGLLVGGVMGGTRALAGLVLQPARATALAVVAAMLATGALHEDGLADTADAIGAHASRQRKLEILRDSRVGTYGALATVVAVVLPVVTLAPLSAAEVLRAALAAHVLGRWSTLPLSRLRPARPSGSGALVTAGRPALIAGSLIAVAVAGLAAGPGAGATTVAVAVAVTALGGWTALRALGGVNGDTFGAVNKCVELATYLTLAAWWG